MKILFLCGSLAYQKDGVGDYTRKLAGELIKQGNDCKLVALMDKEVLSDTHEIQEIDGVKMEVLRLPYENGFHQNIMHSKHWIDSFNPNWISLQYVPILFIIKECLLDFTTLYCHWFTIGISILCFMNFGWEFQSSRLLNIKYWAFFKNI